MSSRSLFGILAGLVPGAFMGAGLMSVLEGDGARLRAEAEMRERVQRNLHAQKMQQTTAGLFPTRFHVAPGSYGHVTSSGGLAPVTQTVGSGFGDVAKLGAYEAGEALAEELEKRGSFLARAKAAVKGLGTRAGLKEFGRAALDAPGKVVGAVDSVPGKVVGAAWKRVPWQAKAGLGLAAAAGGYATYKGLGGAKDFMMKPQAGPQQHGFGPPGGVNQYGGVQY